MMLTFCRQVFTHGPRDKDWDGRPQVEMQHYLLPYLVINMK